MTAIELGRASSDFASEPAAAGGTFVEPFALTPAACVWSAVFSTLGSVFAKVAFGDIHRAAVLRALLRVLALGLMLGCNCLGLKWYVAALRQHSAFQVGVLTFAFGFIATGIAGAVFFGESVSMRWLAGACIIVFGVGAVVSSNPEQLRKRR